MHKTSAHAHGTDPEVEIQIFYNFGRTQKVMNGSLLTHKVANGHHDGDPRTGTFHQMRVTMGDTACSVNGV